MGWTDERVTTLRKLWAEGLSASQVAKQMGGLTRSAVCGKVHRLGLVGRGHQPSSADVVKRICTRRTTKPHARPRAKESFPAPTPLPPPDVLGAVDPTLTTLRLNAFTCRYPIGDPQDSAFTYCGRTCDEESPYCRDHKRLCYQRPLPKNRSVENLVRAELRREQWVAAR